MLNYVVCQGSTYQALVDANESLRHAVENINERVDVKLFLTMHEESVESASISSFRNVSINVMMS